MPTDKERKALADAAAKRKDDTGASYSTALDEVLTEYAASRGLNSKEVFRALLNIPEARPVKHRHRNKTSPNDLVIRPE